METKTTATSKKRGRPPKAKNKIQELETVLENDKKETKTTTTFDNSKEIKFFTKNGNEEIDLVRRKAQSVNFSKIEEILQRNVSQNISKTFTQYTRTALDTYAQSPLNNLDNIREVSRFLTRISMLYKIMLSHLSTMILFNYNITPIADFTKEYNSDKVLKNYEKTLTLFDKFNIRKECQSILFNVLRDGMYVGYMYNSEKDGIFIMPLDVKYCRIYGKTPEGEWIVYMDASYFDQGNNLIYINGVNGDKTGIWDDCFIDGYNTYKSKGRDYQYFRLTCENTFCLICSPDDEYYMPLPYFFPLFKSLLQLLDTENLIAAKEELQNYKLILNRIPMNENSEMVDDFKLSMELVEHFDALVSEILPDLVAWATVPYEKPEVISFDKSTSTDDTDSVNKSINNLLANAGINKLVISSGDSSNANGIKYSIINDLSKMSYFLKRIESWFNYWIKKNITDNVKLVIFEQTEYNNDDFIKEKKEAMSLGGSKMDYFCSLGDTPLVAYNKLRFETLSLQLDKYMNPPQSTYTISSNTSAGRPELDETELSDEGAATRASGKNDDKGNK